MSIDRREFLGTAIAAGSALATGGGAAAAATGAPRGTWRIATEEAFSIAEVIAEARRIANGVQNMSTGLINPGPLMDTLLDLGPGRIAGMDADGVGMQLLSLSAPGVQNFDAATAVSLARVVNDRIADVVRSHPARFAALAAVAPQAPAATATELQRAVQQLGLKGGIINSHTRGEYLDEQKFWPIFEAAEALDVPIYLHPREPSPGMAAPLAIPGFTVGWGYAVETGTHALRLIASGVFDRFPRLRLVIGHLGETLPFLLDRIDNRYLWQTNLFNMPRMRRLPSEYFRDNFVITTSGMNYAAPVQAALAALGADKLLFAADHPMEVQADAVREMDAIPMAAADKRKVYELNARRVFKL